MGTALAKAPGVVWDYDDYRQMPDDGLRYEVLEGDLLVSPAPTLTHQTVSKRLHYALLRQIEEKGLGYVYAAPTDVIFSGTSVVQPDLLVIRPSRSNRLSQRAVEGAPDLIIEILSPHSEAVDRRRKPKLYASQGVLEYWVVDAEEHRVEVFTIGADGAFQLHRSYGAGEQVDSTLFAVAIAVDDLFAPGFSAF